MKYCFEHERILIVPEFGGPDETGDVVIRVRYHIEDIG